jgi:uncharacterized protein YecA (UPF0149 family)
MKSKLHLLGMLGMIGALMDTRDYSLTPPLTDLNKVRKTKHTGSVMHPDSYAKYCKERTVIGRNDPCPCGSGLKFKKCNCKKHHK